MITFQSIPENLIPVFQEYLTHDDYRYFMNCSKKEFQSIKYESVFYSLTCYNSFYYCTDLDFHQKVNSRVKSSFRQVGVRLNNEQRMYNSVNIANLHDLNVRLHSLTLGARPFSFKSLPTVKFLKFSSYEEEILPELPLLESAEIYFADRLFDITALRHLQKVYLSSCPELKDVSCLSNVQCIRLESCNGVSDLSALGKQKYLEIRNCMNVVDISSLSKVHTLILFSCPQVADVRPLRGVHTLTLHACKNIQDIRGLGGHHSLTINRCQYQLNGYESLRGIPVVSLQSCDIADLTVLAGVKTLFLEECRAVTDLRPIANELVHLTIMYCLGIQSFPSFPKLMNFHIIRMDTVDRSYFPDQIDPDSDQLIPNNRIRFLGLNSFTNSLFLCNHFHELFPEVTSLKIFSFHSFNFRNILMLKRLQFLFFFNCSCLISFVGEGFAEIHTIIIRLCGALRDISGLGRNHSVELHDCPRVVDVSSLRTVQNVKIISCPNIQNLSCLENVVPRLRIVS